MSNVLVQRCAQQTTSEPNIERSSLDLYKHIVDEIYFRAEKGDTYALEILKKAFSETSGVIE